MKRASLLLVLILLSLAHLTHASEILLSNTTTAMCFSPNGNCTQVIVNETGKAKSDILLQAYLFTSAPIAKALAGAHKRGVKVEVIPDETQRKERYTSATFLSNAKIPIYIFTKAAEGKTVENLPELRSEDLARIYSENWRNHHEHSNQYRDRQNSP